MAVLLLFAISSTFYTNRKSNRRHYHGPPWISSGLLAIINSNVGLSLVVTVLCEISPELAKIVKQVSVHLPFPNIETQRFHIWNKRFYIWNIVSKYRNAFLYMERNYHSLCPTELGTTVKTGRLGRFDQGSLNLHVTFGI